MCVLHPRSPGTRGDAAATGSDAGAAIHPAIAGVTDARLPPGNEVADDVENAVRRFVESVSGHHWGA